MATGQGLALFIDPPSYHFLGDKLFDTGDSFLNGDHIHNVYAELRQFFGSKGIPVHTADRLSEKPGDVRAIYVSMGMLGNYRRLAKRQDVVLSAFFAMECPVVEPTLYQELKKAQHYFKRVFSWSDSDSLEHFVGGPLRCQEIRWPQSFDDVHEGIWEREHRKFLVLINKNKLPAVYWHDLYLERLRAIRYFSETGDLDLYGVGWDEPPYQLGKTWKPGTLQRIERKIKKYWLRIHPDPMLEAAKKLYRGKAASKSETLGQYTFAICFENSILKGWITEKIFDCFYAGTIPVYWGAPDIEEHVPADCFIDMRKFASYGELRSFLKSLSPAEVRAYKENARAYLRSPRFHPSSKAAFIDRFRQIVEEDADISLGGIVASTPTAS